MATFTVSHEEDCARRTKSGKPSKLRTSLNKSIQETLSNISADWLSSWCAQSTAFYLDIPNKNVIDTTHNTSSDGKSSRECASFEVHKLQAGGPL